MTEKTQAPSKWAVLAVVALGVFMATLDASIVNISLPAIASHFHRPLGPGVEWVVLSYLVTVAALLLTIGHLADLFGTRPIWIGGLVVFTLGSALCGAAPSLASLVGFRALQGIGGAMLMAISPALLTSAFPREERGRAIGLNAVFVSLGISAGPTLGGLITHVASWRWIFYVNLPIGAVAITMAARILARGAKNPHRKLDLPGAGLLAIGLAALTLALSFGPEIGWGSLGTRALLVLAAIALVVLPFVERRRAEPVLDLSLFGSRVFSSAVASLVLSFVALFATSLFMPFYLQQLRGWDAARAGILLTPFPLVVALVAPFAGSLADRVGTRGLAFGGLAIASFGLVLLSRLDESSSALRIVLALIVAGAGQALFQSPNNSALLGAAPPSLRGAASGMLATARVVGQSLGVAIASAVFASAGGGLVRGHARAALAAEHFVHAFRVTFEVCAAIALLGAFVSLVRGDDRAEREHAAGR